ncbi:hypothetical protein EYR40_000967 [Pleurotus pulmonarius]|nr:hypothetical protein EYR38_004212 [Pleurotus pulmonarius]KAF4608621.1 hypothetical protein EYR40_000967 [Pleurotus pulmonarius]
MHDNTFYFDDGSIVLAACSDYADEEKATYVDTLGPTSSIDRSIANEITVYFRVHRSILVGESEVFKDMFIVGQTSASTTNAEVYDGVPLIVMQDKAEDVRGFLQAIYKPRSIHLPPGLKCLLTSMLKSSVFLERYDPASAKLLTSPLLLAVKYQADNLKDRIIEQLEADWPASDYSAWKYKREKLEAGMSGCGMCISEPVDLLQLIRKVNMPDDSLKKLRAVALHNMLGLPDDTYYDVDPALDARDCLALVAGQTKTNNLLWSWIKLEEPIPGTTANDEGPAFDDCPRCKAKMFRDELFAKWMGLSLYYPDALVFLDMEARHISEGHGSAAALLCSYECRKEAEAWMDALAEEFYRKLDEIYYLIDLSDILH